MTTSIKHFALAAALLSISLPAMADEHHHHASKSGSNDSIGHEISQKAGELKNDISNRLERGDQTHEISAAGSGLAFGGDQDVSFNINTTYSYLLRGLLEDNIQATGAVGLTILKDNTVVNALVGPTFNYKFADKKLENAAFLTALVGIAFADTPAGSSTEFAYNVNAGKRFGLNDYVSWKPSIGLGKGGTFAKETTSFLFVPFQFSFFL